MLTRFSLESRHCFRVASRYVSGEVNVAKTFKKTEPPTAEDVEETDLGSFKAVRRGTRILVTPSAIKQMKQAPAQEFKQEAEIKEEIKKIIELDDFRTQEEALAEDNTGSQYGEYGFRYKGPEPTRFGDWSIGGRVSDF